jgi:hypothetical protein
LAPPSRRSPTDEADDHFLLLVAIEVGGATVYLTEKMGATANRTFSRIASTIQSTGGAPFVQDEAGTPRKAAARDEAVARADKPGAVSAGGDGLAPAAATPVKRQIISNATVSVVAPDCTAKQKELAALVKQHNAFVAKSDILGNPGAPRSGQWKIRVPVEQFDAFMVAVVALRIPEKNAFDSRNVTEG